MPRLRELHVNARGFDEPTVFQPEFVQRLRVLRLERVRLEDEGVRRLARQAWPSLRVLQIWNGRFSDAGAAALARNKSLRKLELLDVSFNHLTAAGVEALRRLGVPVVAEYQMTEGEDTDDEYYGDEDDLDEFEIDWE